jgi:peptidoglycan/LPS O-acetylase OafA/YrhL
LIYAAALLTQNVHTHEPGFLSGLPLRLGYSYLFFRGAPPTLDGVTWTLEIEVQFYLLAPFLAQVFKLAAGPRRLALLVAICGFPPLADILPRGGLTLLGFAQFFLTGFLLADLHTTGFGLGRVQPRALDLLGFVCLLALVLVPETPSWMPLLPCLLAGIFVGALRGHWFTSFLRRPAVSVLGGMCYSLYLLHYPFLSFIAAKIISNGQSLPRACMRLGMVGMPVAVGAGLMYYILIERPCMNPNWPHAAWQRCLRMIDAISAAFKATSKSTVD